MAKEKQRRLRRRSPSDLSQKSNSSSTQKNRRLVRSTTMEELESLSKEGDCKLQLDLRQLSNKTVRNEMKTNQITTTLLGWQTQHPGTSFDDSSSGEDATSLSSVDDVEDKMKTNSHLCRETNDHDTLTYLAESSLSPADICDDVISSITSFEVSDCTENVPNLDELDDKLRKFKAKRVMTKTQERWNALTMIPNPLYCCYFLLSGNWLTAAVVEKARGSQNEWMYGDSSIQLDISYWDKLVGADEYGCLNYEHSMWRHMPAMPPFPAMVVAIGICLHAPFSFIYHWKYANRPDALTHWSRRMDQAMIHVAAALMSYATSGSLKYFLINCLYNLDCCYKQLFDPVVKPFRNQIRVFLSMLLYTLPILRRGDCALFSELWMMLGICGWLFATYPVGGWSHAIFHLVAISLPPLLMIAACDLPSSQHQMLIAAQCAVRSAVGDTALS